MKAFHRTSNPDSQRKNVVAALANLLAYLNWLRGGEIFEREQDNLVLTLYRKMALVKVSLQDWGQSSTAVV